MFTLTFVSPNITTQKKYLTTETEPFDILLKQSAFERGQHSLKGKIYIVGEYCDETVLEVSDEFYGGANEDVNYADFYIDYNRVENGGVLVVEPLLNEKRSAPGTKIDRVDYYWDGQLAKTATEAPFTWNSQRVNEENEPHSWRVVISYSNSKTSNLHYDFIHTSYSTLKDDSDYTFFEIMSRQKKYELGETISSIVKSYQGKNSKKKISIKLYFDGVLIGESSNFPYKNDFKLTNQKEGIHVLKCAITSSEGDTSVTSYSEEKVIVTLPSK